MTYTSVNDKENYNRSLWEQIREEQVTLITPLEFAWVTDGMNHIATITDVPAIIGRDKRYSDITIEDQYVARMHARIDLHHNEGGYEFSLSDLDSTNGTRIDGVLVNKSTIFKPGQTLTFGRTNLRVKALKD